MELIKIVNARSVLENFSDEKDIGAHLAYWMTKFVAKTASEHEFYVSETMRLIEKYGTKNEDGSVTIPNEVASSFDDAIRSLNVTDVEDPGIRFNLSELSAELKLSMKQMYALLDFIDEEK